MSINPLQSEVSRILQSDSPNKLANQLKQLTSYQSRIEEELITKTNQIYKLQNYVKQEIANIQQIAEENNLLKLKLDEQSKQICQKEDENNALKKQVKELSRINEQLNGTIKLLGEQNCKLHGTRIQQQSPIMSDITIQTHQHKQQTDSIPFKDKNTLLLDKISDLQELVMRLKHQKNQLKQKVYLLENESNNFESTGQEDGHDASIHEKLLSKTIFDMIIQGTLKQSKFKGEIVNDKKEGKGICEYQDNIVYQGHFHEGRRQGLGTLKIDGQMIYRGYWKNGVMQGKGMLKMFEGEIQSYEGQFYEGKLQGYGCMHLKSGKRVIACWRDGKIIGNCLQTIGNTKYYRKPELIQCY